MRKFIKLIPFLVGVLPFLICLAPACDPGRGDPDPRNRNVSISLSSAPRTLDPRLADDQAARPVIRALFNGLVKIGPDARPKPDLAERWENPDEAAWVFHLRPGVRFHNGRELTAEDVAYTYNWILDPKSGSPHAPGLSGIKKVEVRGPHTVVFHTYGPFAPTPARLTVGIVPVDEAEELGEDFGRRPVGSGPFRLVKYEPGKEIRLEAFQKHFRGRPRPDEATFKINPDPQGRYLALIAEEVDLALDGLPPAMIPVLENKPEFRIVRAPGACVEYLALNTRDEVLSRASVRSALSRLLTRDQAGPGLPWSSDAASLGCLAPTPILSDRDGSLEADLEAADLKNLVYLAPDNAWEVEKATWLEDRLARIGVSLDLQLVDEKKFKDRLTRGEFQLASCRWFGPVDPDDLFLILASKSLPPRGRNWSRFVNPSLDSLLEAGRRTLDPKARNRIYVEARKIVARQAPIIVLGRPDRVLALRRSLVGFSPSPAADLSSLPSLGRRGPTE